MYKVIFDSEAINFLEKAEKDISKRIWSKIMTTKEKPHRSFERLSGRKDYKLRIGDYRAIADIDDKNQRIEITLIDHRSRVYKRLK
ncbi:type II toxin-antitoxin system RelE/ParE family toxin [Candidatus Woesearchaeota archaeon]|nr:type II toxin-antitoxin system RelE/ParE family toxin [Candidatus Woesearchaeota archaeon]